MKKQPNFFMAFLGFRRMVSPFFISIVYFIGLIGIIAFTVWLLVAGPGTFMAKYGLETVTDKVPVLDGIAMSVVSYLLIILFGLFWILIWRFYCEILIVMFGIFNRLGDINQVLHKPPLASAIISSPPPPPAEPTPTPSPSSVTAEPIDAEVEEISDEPTKPESDPKSNPDPDPDASGGRRPRRRR